MRYGIIADIHGNLEALQAVIRDGRNCGVREFFCLGDIVGYGANPNECIKTLIDLKTQCIAGNHEWAVLELISDRNFNPEASEAVIWTRKALSIDHVNFLKKLELVVKHDLFIMTHGSLNQPEEFHYIKDISQTKDTFFLMDRPVCFIGHTHVPQIFIQKQDGAYYEKQSIFELDHRCRYIINVGSVGQPRDHNPQASYCIYDPDLDRIQIKRVSYDVSTAQRKIEEAGLPRFLSQRLSLGQ